MSLALTIGPVSDMTIRGATSATMDLSTTLFFRGFYLSGEVQNSKILCIDESDKISQDETLSTLTGIGKTFGITHRFKMRASVYYNFLHDPTTSQYNSPWRSRIGFVVPKVSKLLK